VLPPDIAEGYITIDGRAEVRVPPTEIRVVLAVTAEAESAKECREKVDGTIDRIKSAWGELKIPEENIVADFVAILPRYEWTVEKRGEVEAAVEKRVGYQMQTNLHLAVKDDDTAYQALTRAFDEGVTDVIGFDYWSRDLDEIKQKARKAALGAARQKTDGLLGDLFEKKPRAINVQEHTTVYYPESLYQSFTAGQTAQVSMPIRRDIPFFGAQRPRNTYYRGLFSDGDIQARELPMKPEISVVSSVRLYFQSPAAREARQKRKWEKKARR
jgi:uncharacterized protein YggE